MRPVLITAVVLGACALGSIFSPATSQPPERLPELGAAPGNIHTALYGVDKPGAPRKEFLHRPATSCASASCHGGGELGRKGSEHTTWAPEAFPPKAEGDPHSKAYSVLFNPVSVEMVRKLGFKDSEGKPILAHQAPQCLTCHAVDSAKDPATREQILSEGVGCSACHGPADKWIGIHYTAEWQGLSNREKWEKYGFVPTKNLVARTLNCASCHVGDGNRDMNHDFIAAGHPRLAFEPARFHAQPDYRKHWTEKGPYRDFEVRLWVIGQATTLRAAVNLLYERAKRAEANDKNTPWPEFSGHSCYACHQKIPSTDVRGTYSESTRRPGVPGWEVWSTTAYRVAADSCGLAFPGLSSSGLSDVKLLAVEKLKNLLGDRLAHPPKQVREHAEAALQELDAWLAALQWAEDAVKDGVAKDTPRVIAHKLTTNALGKKNPNLLADHDWDALAANYLGAAAMYAASGKDAAEWTEPLLRVRDSLRFPPVKDGNGVYNSPFDRDRKKLIVIRENFDALRTKTSTPEGK